MLETLEKLLIVQDRDRRLAQLRAEAARIPTEVAAAQKRVADESAKLETAKNELGLDHNETRSWHGWHRHVSLVMLAFAMMAAIRHRANLGPLKKTVRRPRTKRS